jgi:hypothetical protein
MTSKQGFVVLLVAIAFAGATVLSLVFTGRPQEAVAVARGVGLSAGVCGLLSLLYLMDRMDR